MAGKPRILIVEDNTDIRRLYALGLNQHGFEVKLASNGAEAVVRVESERPDVILLDLYMPVMSGWEVIDRINPPEAERPIPVIVVTGQPREEGTAIPPCIVSWLSKPVAIADLASEVHQVVKQAARSDGGPNEARPEPRLP